MWSSAVTGDWILVESIVSNAMKHYLQQLKQNRTKNILVSTPESSTPLKREILHNVGNILQSHATDYLERCRAVQRALLWLHSVYWKSQQPMGEPLVATDEGSIDTQNHDHIRHDARIPQDYPLNYKWLERLPSFEFFPFPYPLYSTSLVDNN